MRNDDEDYANTHNDSDEYACDFNCSRDDFEGGPCYYCDMLGY
jgi:hypothetical protein